MARMPSSFLSKADREANAVAASISKPNAEAAPTAWNIAVTDEGDDMAAVIMPASTDGGQPRIEPKGDKERVIVWKGFEVVLVK